MSDLIEQRPKRKVLSLKLEKQTAANTKTSPPQYLRDKSSVYMVWCPSGDMPKRVYLADEKERALGHAKSLAREKGERFYVMRSWRAFEPDMSEDAAE